jgi:Sulfotransferase family
MNGMPARIVHMHIPKTAGTAFRKAFQKAAGGTVRSFPHHEERKYQGVDASQFDFFSGHFGFKTAKQLNGEILTVLRNPIERFISVYYFWRRLSEMGVERSHRTFLANHYPLGEFAKIRDEPALVEALYNTMTWQIAHGSSSILRRELREMGKTDSEIFQLAVTNLSTFALVGVQDRLDLFSKAIEAKFSLALAIKKDNVSKERIGVTDLDSATRQAIQAWTLMDLELYEQANNLVSQSDV